MSDAIIFRGAYIRSFEFRNGDGEQHVRIHMTADWTEPLREHMKWGDVPEGFAGADLVGRLAASHVILSPSPKALRSREVQIDAYELSGFNLVPLKDSGGEVTGRELRFTIKSAAKECCALLESYLSAIGRGVAALKVSYVKQENLALDEERQQATGAAAD